MAPTTTSNGRRRRVLLFPFPYQGHLNPMFRLAAALHDSGLAITVLHTELRAPDATAHPADYRFVPIPDNLPTELAASEDVAAFVLSLNAHCEAPVRDRLAALLSEAEAGGDGVCCVITDVCWFSAQAAARALGVPALTLMTSSAASFRTFMAYPLLREKGYLPVQEWQLDTQVNELPPFRVRDLQRIDTSSLDTFAELLSHIVAGVRQSSGLILNTFDAIEAANVDQIRNDMCIPVFAVGPLNKSSPTTETSLLPQDRSCKDWLARQAPNSVIYVSFGSLAALDVHEFEEMAWGLANSKRPFVWVVRPSLVRGLESGKLPDGLQEVIHDRGRIVSWAPQLELLGHPAICAFLTHNGWNSTVESISEGVPMICRPCFGDQMGTARYACDVWKVGVEVEVGVGGRLERGKVLAAIEKMMVEREGEEVRDRMMGLKKMAAECIEKGGSSHDALKNLVDFILSCYMYV